MELYRIDSRYAVFGVVFNNDVVVRVAPIAAYMMGWSISKVLWYAHRKQWEIQQVELVPDE